MSGGGTSGHIAFIISVVSLLVSGGTLYYTFLQGPAVSVSVGSPALINFYGRIGLHCTFTNEGARQAVITSAEIDCENPRVKFPGSLASESLEKWTFDEKGGQNLAEPTKYTLFTPVAVKQRDNAHAVIWFMNGGHRFSAQKYVCTIKAAESAGGTMSRRFELALTNEDVANLTGSKTVDFTSNLTQSSTAEPSRRP